MIPTLSTLSLPCLVYHLVRTCFGRNVCGSGSGSVRKAFTLRVQLTAVAACGIVAGNRFDGYLFTAPIGQAIEDSPDSVLKGDDYWFQVPQGD